MDFFKKKLFIRLVEPVRIRIRLVYSASASATRDRSAAKTSRFPVTMLLPIIGDDNLLNLLGLVLQLLHVGHKIVHVIPHRLSGSLIFTLLTSVADPQLLFYPDPHPGSILLNSGSGSRSRRSINYGFGSGSGSGHYLDIFWVTGKLYINHQILYDVENEAFSDISLNL
jgi:hypothetical protein